ncbi:sperm-associated antigen 1 [Fundulus heteroclitus]|uniref:sperm-associated antigen 1 n=1 Tax=Fundulus heteroclitus TaxID=8078 RepID=UPI00165BE5FA|nr:sperm-associated antigen 1 [Fundulus heteroclitus]XP_012727968.2 sperm-associated antigen 1 [Fundulus heteroclitus]XP_021177156.2 sperm-associated antigen 1 [Fundulus heteroclitus]
MSGDTLFPLQTTDVSAKVPVDHLDYDFIETCKDVKYLEKILRILRSGEEGIYPHLIKFCESHLEKLNPKSRALRKENPVATKASFSKDEWNQIVNDLMTWAEETKETERLLKEGSGFNDLVKGEIPPVRSSSSFVPLSEKSFPKQRINPSKRILPRDYQEWDKFDVEGECEKIDGNMLKNDPPAILNTGNPNIKREVDASLLSQQEKLLLANREKDKGNEAFRANDYEEAVAYYTRSLSILATVSAYNNRAQAEIILEHWHEAMRDCQQVLELEPRNKKALLRRATVHNHMGNFQMASEDLRMVLQEEPNNPAAIQLLSKIEKKVSDSLPEQQSKGKKLLIEEVEEDYYKEEQEEQRARPVQPSQPVGGERSSAAPVVRGDMGNAQKKPHSRGDGGPHTESSNSHHGHWRGKGGASDKYKVPEESKEKVANGSSKRASTASEQGDKSGSSKGTTGGGKAEEAVNLDAPCGALPPRLSRLKNEGNLLFKNGQFADALEKYSQAIQGYTDSGVDSPEDLCVLYSNRAACYLKDGNSQECIQDCTRALELQPFSLKPLLRRAMAYESLERYRKAYVDYKTVLQIDISVQAAHDSVNRITRLLIEQDGPEWRDNLPDIPIVPLSAQQHRREEPPSQEVLQARAEKATQEAERRAEIRFSAWKQEGNEFVKKGQYQEALGKYTECLKLKPKECAIYTNRALCYLKLERFPEAKQDCDTALELEPDNKKAFYRRALANKGLQDYLACSSDLQQVLQLDPNVQEAEKELEEVTVLLRQSLARSPDDKARKTVPITEVDDDEDRTDAPNTERSRAADNISVNLKASNAYEFGQSLNAARCSGNTAACAELLASTEPEMLPKYLSNQLDGNTVSFIMKALDSDLLEKNPNLVYRHLSHLHTTDRFSVVLLQLEKDERRIMTQLFEHLSAAESAEFTRDDVENLANKYV